MQYSILLKYTKVYKCSMSLNKLLHLQTQNNDLMQLISMMHPWDMILTSMTHMTYDINYHITHSLHMTLTSMTHMTYNINYHITHSFHMTLTNMTHMTFDINYLMTHSWHMTLTSMTHSWHVTLTSMTHLGQMHYDKQLIRQFKHANYTLLLPYI